VPDLPDLSRPRRIHVIAAGGTGMSAIATVLAGMGHHVTGSDASDSLYLRHLAGLGVEVHVGHRRDLAVAADLVVRSTAVPDTDPEVVAARHAGLTVWRRADVLAAICRQSRTLAISGTHGKTTTSSMAAVTLRAAGRHPSMIVGGEISGIGPGASWDPAGEWLVVEADESDGTFVELGAEVAVVTSVEADHLEHYGGLDGLLAAFDRFVIEPSGPAVLCLDDPGAARLASVRGAGHLITYGFTPAADVVLSDLRLGRAEARFHLRHADWEGPVSLAVPGRHNVLNAAAAVSAAVATGATWEEAVAGVATYRGVARRFEAKGSVAGVSFVDGYDHLPTEVAAAIATARSGEWPRLVVVFQPHRYSRTKSLWRDFGGAFVGADEVVITGIYPAGEDPRPGVSGRLIVDAVAAAHPGTSLHYAEDLDQAEDLLAGMLREGDLCLTLGAGDVTTMAGRLMARLSR
jgi:UDP-N-acetylmuramate--alanine ligase